MCSYQTRTTNMPRRLWRCAEATTSAYTSLLNHLVPLCRELAHRCRVSSLCRSRFRAFETNEKQVKELLRGLPVGLPSGKPRGSALRAIKACLETMERIARSSVFSEGDRRDLQMRLKRLALRKKRAAATPVVGRIELLVPVNKRPLYRQLTKFVLACAPSKRVATSILERIARRLARQRRG